MFLLFALCTFFSPPVSAQTPAEPALKFNVSFEENFPEDLRKQLLAITESALTMVRHFTPPGHENNLFHWSASREILKGKTMNLCFATSRSSFLSTLRRMPGGVSPDTDSITLAPTNRETGEMKIHLCLLVDKIFFDEDGRERPDGLSRLIVALAHEIFGNVQSFLEMPIDQMSQMTLEDRRRIQQRGFEASIRFLTHLLNHPDYAKLPPRLQAAFPDLLVKEQRALEAWR